MKSNGQPLSLTISPIPSYVQYSVVLCIYILSKPYILPILSIFKLLLYYSLAASSVVFSLQEATDYLLSHPAVRKPYAGVIGVSKGAEMAILLATVCPKVYIYAFAFML